MKKILLTLIVTASCGFVSPFSVDPNEKTLVLRRISANTDLQEGAQHNNLDMVNRGLKYGANLNIRNWLGLTPLMLAIQNQLNANNQAIIKLLIDKGADINAQSYLNQDTALMIAVSHNYVFAVKELLIKHPNITLKNDKGQTAYNIALKIGNKEIIKMLESEEFWSCSWCSVS